MSPSVGLTDEIIYTGQKAGIKITVTRKKLLIDATKSDVLIGEYTWDYLDYLRASLFRKPVLVTPGKPRCREPMENGECLLDDGHEGIHDNLT